MPRLDSLYMNWCWYNTIICFIQRRFIQDCDLSVPWKPYGRSKKYTPIGLIQYILGCSCDNPAKPCKSITYRYRQCPFANRWKTMGEGLALNEYNLEVPGETTNVESNFELTLSHNVQRELSCCETDLQLGSDWSRRRCRTSI